jgi:hypothetical protein
MAKVLMMVNDEEQPIRIGKMKVKQLKKALKKIQEVINLVQGEESTSELMSYFMNMDKKPEGEGVGLGDLEDSIFMENVLGAFKVLFNKIPDEITELISIVSGIEEDIIDEQDYDVLFDIVTAIIEENDIKSMIDRAKQTFFTARSKWGGIKALKGSQA